MKAPAKAKKATGGELVVAESGKSDNVVAFEATPEQFQQLSEVVRVNLDESDETLAAMGADALSRAEFNVMQAGAYFLKLKSQTGHGNFQAALDRVGVSPKAAQRSIQMASYVAMLPADQARKIASLPKTKILQLVNADQVVVQQLMDEGSLEGDQALSVRDLRGRLKALEGKCLSAENREEAIKNELRMERQTARQRAAETGQPPFAQAARDDSVELVQQMAVCLDGLHQVVDMLSEATEAKRDPVAAATAAGTLYHLLMGELARGIRLTGLVAGCFNLDIGMVPSSDQMLTEAEIALALKHREAMTRQAGDDKHNRAVKRQEKAVHKTAGRPLKAKGSK